MGRVTVLSLLIVSLPVLHGCGRSEGPPKDSAPPATTANPAQTPTTGNTTTGNAKVIVATPVSRSTTKGDAADDKVDVAKLRELVEVPTVHVYFDFRFRYGERDGRGNLIEPAKEIARLIPKLNGSINDAEVYLELAGYYHDLKDKAKSKEVTQRAEKLLQPYANTANPKEAWLLLNYVDARRVLEPERWQEWEKMLLRVVELDPGGWKGWSRLCTHMFHSAQIIALGGVLLEGDSNKAAVEKVQSGLVPQETIRQLEQRIKYARHCSDQAKKLAPTDERQWEDRIAVVLLETPWTNTFEVLRGGNSIPTAPAHTPEAVARGFGAGMGPGFDARSMPAQVMELKAAAQACPEHIGIQVFGMMSLLPLLEKKAVQAKNGGDVLSPDEKQYVKEWLDRLENITRKAKPECATYCRRAETCLRFKVSMLTEGLQAITKLEPYFRALLDADPADHDAADVFEFLLDEQKKHAESIEVARKRFALKPTTRHRYMLARSYLRCDKNDKAVEELEAALKTDPVDGHCLGGMAAMLMKEGSKDSLVAAGKLLEKARANLKPRTAYSPAEDVDYLCALHAGMTGQPTIARLNLDLLRTKYPGNKRYEDALAALGPAPAPATLNLTEAPLLPTPPKTPPPMPSGPVNIPAVFTNPTSSSLASPPVLPSPPGLPAPPGQAPNNAKKGP